MIPSREAQLSQLLVRLADTLTEDTDPVELMTVLAEGTVSILAVHEAGVVLADARGSLRVTASSSERMRDLELHELQNQDGPCLECFSSGTPVVNVHLDTISADRWPHFAPRARQAGYRVVHAFPIRHRAQTIGMVNAFDTAERDLGSDEIQMGEAMAQMAAIGLLNHRAASDRESVIEQLQHALEARVSVEQAKGVLSERRGTSLAEAYQLLRGYARRHGRTVASVAVDVLSGELTGQALAND
jgi:GAF domain-containing protein